MNKLPEKYIVECKSEKETFHVQDIIYGDHGHFPYKYLIIDPKFKSWEEHPNRLDDWSIIIEYGFSDYPVFSYKE